MPLQQFKATDFRCLRSIELTLDPVANLISGPNAAGKTSILEAIAYLGRGKSFRGAATHSLIRHGQGAFVLHGTVESDGLRSSVGVRNSAAGLEISVGGDRDGGAAALAEVLPLQVIDPDVHDLVAGPPDARRRYLDWIAFHVEHGYLALWRRFRRALKQRNAALKAAAGGGELDGWDREFVGRAEELTEWRRRVFESARPCLEDMASELVEAPVAFDYRQGWAADHPLMEVLKGDRQRDLRQGNTQHGPQRADLRLQYDDRQAKKLVSRGQQKLLACSMILAATEIAQTALERPLLLLLDDPAAELDRAALGRLMAVVNRLGCQVVATALVPDEGWFADPPALFHVERGVVERVR